MDSILKRWVTGQRIAAAIAAGVVFGIVATLVGWLVDSTLLKALLPGRVAMNPGATLLVVTMIAVSTGAIVWAVNSIERATAKGAAMQAALREREIQYRLLNDQLESRVEERTRELTEANRDLAEKNRENETFVYGVSHDLRSPLVNLQGFSLELEQSCTDLADSLNSADVPEEVRRRTMRIMESGMQEPIYFIRTAVTRLGAIIDALLRLSRAGRIEYQICDVNLDEVVRRIVDSMRVTLAQRGARLTAHPLPSVRGDVTALEQVFANLIGNALNYLDPARQGEIEIGADPLTDENSPRQRSYFVRDNGLGIPAAHQGKVFQAFQRLHPSSAPGEGMGLTIVRRVIERHGGRIWLESMEGQGTTFFVSLPVAASKEASAIRQASFLEPVPEDTERRMDAYRQEELCHAH